MKKSLFISIVVVLAIIGPSCKKPFSKFKEPKAQICGPSTAEVGELVTFTWCGDEADEIEWDGVNGVQGNGETFSMTFNNKGKYTVYVYAKRKYSKTGKATFEIEIGKNSGVWCSMYNACNNGGTIYNSSDLVNYKGYLYSTKDDWQADVIEGKHVLCIDSASGSFSSSSNAAGILFRKQLPSNTTAFVSVEYRNPAKPDVMLSNWSNLMRNTNDGLVNANNMAYTDNYASVQLNESSKKVLAGTWKLSAGTLNNVPITLSSCNLDDYLRFYPDGKWNYFVGVDNCNATSSGSEGSYSSSSIPTCNSSGGSFSMNTSSGPFSGLNYGIFSNNSNTLTVHFTSGSSSGYYTFTYQP